jgi:hypothetical protein
MDGVQRLNDSKCDIPVSESCITDSYKIPHVLFICPSCLSCADNRSLLYFSSSDSIYNILTFLYGRSHIACLLTVCFLHTDRRQMENLCRPKHKCTHTHIHIGKHIGLHLCTFFFPRLLRLLVSPPLDSHFIFKITSEISENFSSTIACSSFVVTLISSIFLSISSSYLVWIIYACVLLFTVFIISIMSSNTLKSA